MVKVIERINRDIAAIEEAIASLGEQFHDTYSRYLTTLGQAMRQQLILASYHLCTQAYPEAFLNLSFNEKQKLQKAIRQKADRAKQELVAQLHLPAPRTKEHISPDDTLEENLDPLWEEVLELEAEIEPTSDRETPSQSDSPQAVTNPEDLVVWQEKLEKAIVKTLQKLSHDTNLLLQQVGILPKKLPEPVLEAAAKVEAAAETVPGPPNLLNLVIETESDREAQSATVTQLTAIHLRLSEIEFADSSLTALRHQIRNLSVKLTTSRREYQKKQRERAIAEAESAWRASWFDE